MRNLNVDYMKVRLNKGDYTDGWVEVHMGNREGDIRIKKGGGTPDNYIDRLINMANIWLERQMDG